ncbi:MAG: NAD-dependent epimerase/dehydratase family protein [Planctomycetota bacterium]|nr:MAG: NAD-dependent epimerase/dehydratase family protein [Planctomycetota bacterium]
MSWRDARVLVTGGAGFIGSHLVDALVAADASVTVIDDLSTGRAENLATVRDQVRLLESDLAATIPSLSQEPPFDAVFHLAAAVGVELVLNDPVRAIEINVETTSALLRHLAAHGSPPTLVASSSEVYGKPGTSVFSEEDDSLYGSTTVTRWSYAHAKALDEHLALGYHSTRGLPTVVARFFNTVGPRQRGSYGMVLPRFVAAAMENHPIRVYGDGRQTRCFCDVRDVVPALLGLLASPACYGRVFNIGSDRPISIRELAEAVIGVTGSRSRIELVPYEDAYPSGFEDLRHRRPDLRRIRDAVGFEPHIPLEQTIRDIASELARERAGGAA